MSEQRFVAYDKWADSEGNIFKFVVIDTKKLGDKQFILRCNHWSQAQDTCNRLNDTLNELREENKQLRQFINKGRRLSVKELMDNANENELLKKKIRRLEKENEQLRKERDYWEQKYEEGTETFEAKLIRENEYLRNKLQEVCNRDCDKCAKEWCDDI